MRELPLRMATRSLRAKLAAPLRGPGSPAVCDAPSPTARPPPGRSARRLGGAGERDACAARWAEDETTRMLELREATRERPRGPGVGTPPLSWSAGGPLPALPLSASRRPARAERAAAASGRSASPAARLKQPRSVDCIDSRRGRVRLGALDATHERVRILDRAAARTIQARAPASKSPTRSLSLNFLCGGRNEMRRAAVAANDAGRRRVGGKGRETKKKRGAQERGQGARRAAARRKKNGSGERASHSLLPSPPEVAPAAENSRDASAAADLAGAWETCLVRSLSRSTTRTSRSPGAHSGVCRRPDCRPIIFRLARFLPRSLRRSLLLLLLGKGDVGRLLALFLELLFDALLGSIDLAL